MDEAFGAELEDRENRRMRANAGGGETAAAGSPQAPGRGGRGAARSIFQADSHALLDHALTTPTPFRERLVWFWANHFTVSTKRGMVAPAGRRLRARRHPPLRHGAGSRTCCWP